MALIRSEDGQFVITGADRAQLEMARSSDLGVVLLDASLKWISVFTGGSDTLVDVTSAEHPSSPPVGSEWDDVVEFDCVCVGGIGVGELTNAAPDILIVRGNGSYRIRVSARGRDAGRARSRNRGKSDSPSTAGGPVEFYRLDVWQAAPSRDETIRLTSTPEDRSPDGNESTPGAPRDELGRDAVRAAQYVGAVIDRRPFQPPASASTAIAQARQVVRGFTAAKAFRFLKAQSPVTRSGCEWQVSAFNPFAYAYYSDPDGRADPEDCFVGRWAQVRGTDVTLTRPRLIERTWSWYVPPTVTEDLQYADSELVRFPLPESVFRIEIEAVPDDEALTVHVTHRDLPAEFAEPMAAIWANALRKIESRVADDAQVIR